MLVDSVPAPCIHTQNERGVIARICIPFGCHKNQRQAAIIHGSDFERV